MESLCLFLCVSWALIKGWEMDGEGTRGYLAMNGDRSANLLGIDTLPGHFPLEVLLNLI